MYLFDYDGTVCDSLPSMLYSWTGTFEANGYEAPSHETVAQYIRKGLRLEEAVEKLHPEPSKLTPTVVAHWANTYRQIYWADGEYQSQLFEGAETVFRKIKSQGKGLCIVSNKTTVSIQKSLERFGLQDCVDLIVGSTNASERPYLPKPYPDSYHQFIRPLFPQVLPQNTLMIGDTSADVSYAHHCGIASCWVTFGYGHKADLAARPADFEIDGLLNLLAAD